MKRCERLVDYLDCNEFDTASKSWIDLQEHSKKCPDCSADYALRKKIINELREMNTADLPTSLHTELMQSIEMGREVSDPTILDELFNRLLLPLQYGFAIVCFYLVFSLATLPSTNNNIKPALHRHGFSIAGKRASLSSIKIVKPDQLAKVTPEEVSAFLRKLNKYKREHPEIDTNYRKKFSRPMIRLVSDW